MKTIKAFANEHNYNKQAVYLRLKRLQKLNPDQVLYEKYGNKFVFTDTGLTLLEQDLKENPLSRTDSENTNAELKDTDPEVKIAEPKATGKDSNSEHDSTSELLIEIEKLKGQLQTRDKEIEQLNIRINEKDQLLKENKEQIEKLNDSNMVLSESIRANQAIIAEMYRISTVKSIESTVNDSDNITEVEITETERETTDSDPDSHSGLNAETNETETGFVSKVRKFFRRK